MELLCLINDMNLWRESDADVISNLQHAVTDWELTSCGCTSLEFFSFDVLSHDTPGRSILIWPVIAVVRNPRYLHPNSCHVIASNCTSGVITVPNLNTVTACLFFTVVCDFTTRNCKSRVCLMSYIIPK